jgi:hypothetical protein
MKKVLTITLIAVFAYVPVFAETTGTQNNSNTNSESMMRQKREVESKLRESGKEIKKNLKETRKENKEEAKALDTVCAQTAVGARETSLITALDTFSTSAKSALEARKTGLVTAWGITTPKERQTARKTAETTYRSSMKSAHDTLRLARKSAWSTFNTEIKKCSGAERYSEQAPMSTEPTSL